MLFSRQKQTPTFEPEKLKTLKVTHVLPLTMKRFPTRGDSPMSHPALKPSHGQELQEPSPNWANDPKRL